MVDLKTMLEFDDKASSTETWIKETSYMPLTDPRFRNRAVLPKPLEVKKKK